MTKEEFFLGVEKVAKGDLPEVKEFGKDLVAALAARGLELGCHVGFEKKVFDLDEAKLEWIMRQFAAAIKSESWYAINSLVNWTVSYKDLGA